MVPPSRHVSPTERKQEEELLSLNLENGKCKYTRLGLPSFVLYLASWLLCHTDLVIMSPNMGSVMYDVPCFFLFYSMYVLIVARMITFSGVSMLVRTQHLIVSLGMP